ncbi:MAG TPA: hypothetical protein VJN94_13430 [Candidatus Binataceae bacterium]|nr:hypothetical protein [Candidatus Binataceae bacterium]
MSRIAVDLSNPAEIWPHWAQGIPTKLRIKVYSPFFVSGRVTHKATERCISLNLEWNQPCDVSAIKKHSLPGNYKDEWRGVYRIFVPNKAIPRCCGEDPTGTLYIGRAGSERGWSILRTRVGVIAQRDHHTIRNANEVIRRIYPWNSLAVQWAYTVGKQFNYKGELIPEAPMAESWLLACYRDSYGELPLWNEKI